MKVKTLKTDSKFSLKFCLKSLVFMCVSILLFLALHPVLLGQQALRILGCTHHIQAIKFSLVYRVAARKGLLAAERLTTSGCYENIASTYSGKVS